MVSTPLFTANGCHKHKMLYYSSRKNHERPQAVEETTPTIFPTFQSLKKNPRPAQERAPTIHLFSLLHLSQSPYIQ